MIFQRTHAWILQPSPHTGELKTQTRRIVKPEHVGLRNIPDYETGVSDGFMSVMVFEPRKRHVWGTGLDYAVQPGRGKRAIGRIRITGIRREDVRDISLEDARAEGFANKDKFLKVWISMHDKKYYTEYIELDLRPAERYDAWVLTFESEASGHETGADRTGA